MADVIISITNRIAQRPNNGFCDELISAEQLAGLTAGCSRVLAALDPKLRLGVELIKITPWKAHNRDYGWYYRYDVKVVLVVPNVHKFEYELQFGVSTDKDKGDLSEALFCSVTEHIRTKLAQYQGDLRAQANRVQHLLPNATAVK